MAIKTESRIRRHKRVRAKVKGTSERPRVSVFRSGRHIWVQLIDDLAGRTIASASDLDIAEKKKHKRMADTEALGALIAKRAADKSLGQAVFDRGPYKYHGLIRAIAEGARKAGLKI